MSRSADHWIRTLALQPHPEGGHFRETWRSPEQIGAAGLPVRFAGPRALGTSIYFLLRAGERSHLHRLRADEVWHFHDGGGLRLHVITPAGEHVEYRLGLDAGAEESPQVVVPHDSWFAAEPAPGTEWVLVGCSVAPGFEYGDFEMGEREDLLARHPRHRELVLRFTQGRES